MIGFLVGWAVTVVGCWIYGRRISGKGGDDLVDLLPGSFVAWLGVGTVLLILKSLLERFD